MPRTRAAARLRVARHAPAACPVPLGLLAALEARTSRGRGGRLAAAEEAGMTRAPKISRAQAVALPQGAAAPTAATEWIVAGVAVLVLLLGLVS